MVSVQTNCPNSKSYKKQTWMLFKFPNARNKTQGPHEHLLLSVNIFFNLLLPLCAPSKLLNKINTVNPTIFKGWRETISGLCGRRERKSFFSFSFFCSLLESQSLCYWNPRVTSVKVNLLPSLGPLMSTLIRKKRKKAQSGDTWMNINLAPIEDLAQSACSLLTVLARGKKSNFSLQSWFSSCCWQFWRRTSYDYFTSKSNGNLSKIPSLEVTIEDESPQDWFWIWNQSICLEEEVLSNHRVVQKLDRPPPQGGSTPPLGKCKGDQVGRCARCFRGAQAWQRDLGRGGGLDTGTFQSLTLALHHSRKLASGMARITRYWTQTDGVLDSGFTIYCVALAGSLCWSVCTSVSVFTKRRLEYYLTCRVVVRVFVT